MAASASSNGNGCRLPKWGDMQGLVLSSYPHRDQAAYLLRLQELESLATMSRNAEARIYIGFDKHTASPSE